MPWSRVVKGYDNNFSDNFSDKKKNIFLRMQKYLIHILFVLLSWWSMSDLCITKHWLHEALSLYFLLEV